jgi:Ca2+-transporting ATPase
MPEVLRPIGMTVTSALVRAPTGLTEQKAQARLTAEGYNELPRQERRTPLRIVLEVLREPMLALLLGAGLVYLLLGDLKEALILLAFGAMSIIITIVQETRTERVLEALRDLTSPRALVIRDGERRRIAGREVARGDLIVLAEGDRVPADALLLEAQDLQTDESLLTGESVPVRKRVNASVAPDHPRPGGDVQPYLYSGSLVVRGSGIAKVIATGPRSEIGKIGQSLQSLDTEPPRLQRQTATLVRLCAVGGAVVSVVAVLLYGTLRGGWLDAMLAGIAIGMSMLPEEFPVVLTVFMAMGAWRISKVRVLTRRAASIETLGSATVLCTDKTGTLTENRMKVAELRLPEGTALRTAAMSEAGIPAEFAQIAVYGLLASTPEPFDPMEKAFHAFIHETPAVREDLPDSSWHIVRGYGLRPDLLAMTQVWQRPDATELVVASKGAPEAIADLCRLAEPEMRALRKNVDAMAADGLRVLGVAAT